MLFRLDGVAQERKTTVGAVQYVLCVGFAPLVIIEVQHEADSGYLAHL